MSTKKDRCIACHRRAGNRNVISTDDRIGDVSGKELPQVIGGYMVANMRDRDAARPVERQRQDRRDDDQHQLDHLGADHDAV